MSRTHNEGQIYHTKAAAVVSAVVQSCTLLERRLTANCQERHSIMAELFFASKAPRLFTHKTSHVLVMQWLHNVTGGSEFVLSRF